MDKHTLLSIEKFAAFLDGNLSQNEMLQFSNLAEHDSVLHQLLDASNAIDNTIVDSTDAGLQFPQEIVGFDFELPTIPTEGISPLVTLTLEPMDDLLVASAACANEDNSLFPDVNTEDHSTIGGRFHDGPSSLIPEDDGFDNNDDLANSFPDDL